MKIIKFSAPWCGPCKQLAKILSNMEPYFEEKGVEVMEINIDEQPDVAEDFGIRSVPTMLFCKDDIVAENGTGNAGHIIDKTVGLVLEDKIKEIIENNL